MLSTQKGFVNGNDDVIRADRALFARLLVIREKRGVSIKECFSTHLVPLLDLLPNWREYFQVCEIKVTESSVGKDELSSVPQNCVRVFDEMCIVQQLPSGLEIFGCLSDFILTRITNSSWNIFFTVDQYWHASIKSCERIDKLPVVLLE